MKHIDNRKVDELGRMVLPVKVRKLLNATTGSTVSVFVSNGEVILRPETPVCKLCGCSEVENENLQLCSECIQKVKAML